VRYAVIGLYVGCATVAGFGWWFLSFSVRCMLGTPAAQGCWAGSDQLGATGMRLPHSAAAASRRRQAHVGDRECTVVRGWQGSAGRLWRRPGARAGAPTAALASPALSACPALPAAVAQAAVAPACAQRGARRAAGGPAAQLAPADAQHGVRERGRVRRVPRPAAGHGRDDGAGGGRDVQRAQRAVREQLAAAGAAPRPARARPRARARRKT